jgi:glycosyltransferase involved in cell wall biosynthesis
MSEKKRTVPELIEVVIPCYNDGAFLEEALESVGPELAERVIIVNDGSTDAETLKILTAQRKKGVHVIDTPNSGLSAARNVGWRASTAKYILFLDADNKVEPRYAEAACEILESDPGVAVVFSDKQEFGLRTGIVVQHVPTLQEELVGNRIDACAVIRRTILKEVEGYDEAMRDGYEDWELWVRLLGNGCRFAHIPEPLFHYRVREGSMLAKTAISGTRAGVVGYVTSKHAALYALHAPQVITELHRIQAHDQATIQRLQTQLAPWESEKEAIGTEAHRVVGLLDKATRAYYVQREHANNLQALVAQYEERIKVIEASRWWRLRGSYHRFKALLRTGSGKSRFVPRWLKRIFFMASSEGRSILRKFLAKVFRTLYLLAEPRPVRIIIGDELPTGPIGEHEDPYTLWTRAHFARPGDLKFYREDLMTFAHRPLFSVLMPVFDPPVLLLDAAIRSVMDQVYSNVELCIANDGSTDPEVRKLLDKWQKDDPRVKVVHRTENGHISMASNSALELVQGEFIAFMDHDDTLAPDAIYHVAKKINADSTLDLLYTDEDKINEQGKHSEPHFKPQWCPDHLLSRNYFGHMVVARAALVRSVGGFREGFEGSQDYDLLLRLTERTQRIARVPRVLYHWRIHAGSLALSEDVKPYAYHAAKRALTEALVRRGEPGEVNFLFGFRGYDIRFTQPLRGKVCVVIPTKDQASVLRTCLATLFSKTQHPDFEVVVVSNNSKEPSLFALLREWEAAYPDRFSWFEHNRPFNFSELMNEGTRRTKAEHILFLNNDTEVIHADWMWAMHEWSQRPTTGAVGAKLLYPNEIIQHAGVVIGLGGVAGHVFAGLHKDGPGYYNYINTINNFSAVTGACLMVERKKLEAIGGWNELFTVEYNDVDLCLRIREKGWHNVYLPHVQLFHHESLTRGHPHMTRESYARHIHEVNLFKEHWGEYINDDPCYNPNLTRGGHDWEVG